MRSETNNRATEHCYSSKVSLREIEGGLGLNHEPTLEGGPQRVNLKFKELQLFPVSIQCRLIER